MSDNAIFFRNILLVQNLYQNLLFEKEPIKIPIQYTKR
jgi:hypothetical protein